MNRPITFRGKCSKSNEWVYGDLIHGVGSCSGKYYILPDKINLAYVKHCDPLNGVAVVQETIGQYIGLEDMKGNRLFVGDIVCNFNHLEWEWRGVVKFSHGLFGVEWLANVKQQSMVGAWGQKHNLRRLDDDILERQVLVGNIFDNPELLIDPSEKLKST